MRLQLDDLLRTLRDRSRRLIKRHIESSRHPLELVYILRSELLREERDCLPPTPESSRVGRLELLPGLGWLDTRPVGVRRLELQKTISAHREQLISKLE